MTKYGYGRKKTQLPETPTQLELEEENAIVAKASSSKRISQLMTSNTTIQTSSNTMVPTSNNPIIITDDIVMIEAPPRVTEQKISIAKNGKKRIQPVMMSSAPVSSVPVPPPPKQHIVQVIDSVEYDDPVIPAQGVATSVTGNKRKSQEDDEVMGNQAKSRVKPEWIDSAVTPPVVQKSQVKMGVPKVKSVLSAKLRPDDPTIVMECHNAPNSHSKFPTKIHVYYNTHN